jgi:hypothetical protein
LSVQFLALTTKNAWSLSLLPGVGTLNSRHYFLLLKCTSFIKNLSSKLHCSMILLGNIFTFLDHTMITDCEWYSPQTSSQCPKVWITVPTERTIKRILPHKKEYVWSIWYKWTVVLLQKMWLSTGRPHFRDGSWEFLNQPFVFCSQTYLSS